MKAQKRRELDPTFKQLLIDYFSQLHIPIDTEVEVSRLPRTIDGLVVVDSAEAAASLQNTPFSHFRTHNQIEFKGARDPLNMAQYALILGRTYLYIGESNLPFGETSVTIVCAGRPNNVLNAQLPNTIFQLSKRGIYQTDRYRK